MCRRDVLFFLSHQIVNVVVADRSLVSCKFWYALGHSYVELYSTIYDACACQCSFLDVRKSILLCEFNLSP